MVVQPEHVSTGDPARDDGLRRAMLDDPVIRKRVIQCHKLWLATVGYVPVIVAYSAHDAQGFELAQGLPQCTGTSFQWMVDWHRSMADGGCDPRKTLVFMWPYPYGQVFNADGGLDPALSDSPTETEAVVVLVDYGGFGAYRVNVEDVPAKAPSNGNAGAIDSPSA